MVNFDAAIGGGGMTQLYDENGNKIVNSGNGKAKYAQVTASKKKQKLADLYNQLMREQEADYKRAEQQQRAALQAIQQGYGNAQAQLSRGADISRRDIGDMMRVNQGAATQSLMNRGLGNTTVLDNAQRAVSADAGRRLSEVNATLAGQMSGLQQARASSMAGAQGALANFYQQRAAAREGLGLKAGSALSYKKPKSGLLGGLGGLVGTVLGGPLGGAVGGMFGGGGGGGQPTYTPGWGMPPYSPY